MLYLVAFALLCSLANAALPAEPFILYTNITNIHALDLNSLTHTSVLSGLDRVVPLGVDMVQKHIYFGEHTLGRIYRANYDGSSVTLIMEDVKNVEGVAIDWIGRKMYWTTYKSETIEVATLDGAYRKVLIYAGLEYPRGMAVDPHSGYLFWSDWGSAAAIERCNLDGSGRIALVKDNITWPNGVTIDYNTKRVYWLDAFHDTISSIDYNGNNRKLIFEDTTLALSQYHGFDLDITGDQLFWTDWLDNAIYGIRISTGVIFRNVSIPTSKFIKGAMGLRVVESSRQTSGNSNCGNNNGGCEQLCFHMVPTGFTCACQLGMKLKADKKSCEDAFKDEFIMFADADAGKLYQMQLDSKNVKPIAVPFDSTVNISRPVALEFDHVDERVYWSDVTLHTICRAFRNGTSFEVLFSEDVEVADGLTIDFAARQLYWTSTRKNLIETSRLDGTLRKTLVTRNLDEPRDIIVDPVDGYIYWTDWGHYPKIERAAMNGENRTNLVTTHLHWPNGLTIDHIYNKLYWADAYEDNIEVMHLETLERKVIINKKFIFFGFLWAASTQVNHPYGLTLLHDKFFWTDWNTNGVYSAGVNTGANIVLMAGGLGKPMDIHAYSAIPKQQMRYHYTFSFPNNRGSNFTCIPSTSCPNISPPPQCPPGYTSVRVGSTCGLYCRDIVGYTYRCPCNDWMSCAVKERYLLGCIIGYYSSFKVRECKQVVRPGRCSKGVVQGSQNSCNSDTDCPTDEKCCSSKCTTPVSIATHPCSTNNGGCDQLCFGVPGGFKCGCQNGYFYNETLQKCVVDTRPTIPPITTPTPSYGCQPLPAPANGSVECDGDPVPHWGECRFKCDEGFDLKGWSWDWCIFSSWIDDGEIPDCVVSTKPRFSFCPNDTTVDTEPGKSYRTVDWKVPNATDYNGTSLTVKINPANLAPPVKLEIGGPYSIDLSAQDKNGERASCSAFNITVEDREPPTFGSTCPDNVTKYTDKNDDVRVPSAKAPTATDNSGKTPSVSHTGYPSDYYYSIGRTVVVFVATDAANLTATCAFRVTIINVCSVVTCTHGAYCALDSTTSNRYMCTCSTVCPQNYAPVCGSDGVTHSNECQMKVAGCTKRMNITVVHAGQCTIPEDCNTKTCPAGYMCQVINQKAKCVCSGSCPENYDPVCGSDLQTYDNECKLKAAACRTGKNITILGHNKCGDCSSKQCDYGADCEVSNVGKAECKCNLACADSTSSVCGSDGVTYKTKCELQIKRCEEQRDRDVIKKGNCGCKDIVLSEKYKTTSTMTCENRPDQFSNSQNSVQCTSTCQNGHTAVFPKFLQVRCYNGQWIRQNNVSKFVPTKENNMPQCYKKTRKTPGSSCPTGSVPVPGEDFCVPCPPGSYKDGDSCKPCEMNSYQDKAEQSSCKDCSAITEQRVTSTTTGAESCYFDYTSSAVELTLAVAAAENINNDTLRKAIVDSLTKYCKENTCSSDSNAKRRKRDAPEFEFKEEHVLILSIKPGNAIDETLVLFILIDPTSTSPLPNKTFSADNLEGMVNSIKNELPYDVKSVRKPYTGGSGGSGATSGDSTSTSKAPVIAGVVIAVLFLCVVVVGAWLFNKRRRKDRRAVPPVHFNPTEGGMQIQMSSVATSQNYEVPDPIMTGSGHGFLNQVYADVNVNDPPPYYETSPIRRPQGTYEIPARPHVYEMPNLPHVYEMPDGDQAGTVAKKEPLPDDAVVDILPLKLVEGMDDKKTSNSSVKFFHKRSMPNVYQKPHIPSQQASAETDLKLEPPPKFDDAKLQVMREKAASSILPNIPRNAGRQDRNANQTAGPTRGQGSSWRQNVHDVTQEQSES